MKKTVLQSRSRYFIDSCGWIEYLSDGEKSDKYAKYIESADPKKHFTSPIVIYEVYKKVRTTYNEDLALKIVAHIKHVSGIVELDEQVIMEAADISISEKLPMADSIILSSARSVSAKVVTSDAHFKGKKGVDFI